MIPASFPESNIALSRPKDMTDEQCSPLCVFKGEDVEGTPVIISLWKLTKEELEEINKTGRVWLCIYGRGMPPVALGTSDPFPK